MAGHVSIRRRPFYDLVNSFPKRQRLLIRAFWTEILFRANYMDKAVPTSRDVIMLRRGQLVMGRDEMALEIGCTPRQIRTLLDTLSTIGELVVKSTNRGSVVTVCKYEIYVAGRPRNGQQRPGSRPGADHSKEEQEEEEQQHDDGSPGIKVLLNEGIDPQTAKELGEVADTARIKKVVAYSRDPRNRVRNPIAWIPKAIRENWTLDTRAGSTYKPSDRDAA
ncbi:MAG: hypothetical protein CME26_02715 [Gemmatimonadetes bacterium]|nr:hypothetical protein [Gemmatimonadota bacterium]|tara:strand:- start:16613 stop:17275 length:663 start_codon:yes stop_codon:yes gene_type:complete